MNSTVISIPNEDVVSVPPTNTTKKTHFSLSSLLPSKGKYNTRQLIHSLKVGFALVLVSLLYLIDPLYEQVGENAMWAIMTVVVIFEFSAGAMLSKGLNRGVGTVLGGFLGCLAAFLADKIGGLSEPVIVGISIFIFGAAASYTRLIPSFKKKYDYGAMIFILTFNLVIVSGLRDKEIFDVARDRLLTIGIGFVICIFVSLIIFPIWSSDELHSSTASKFHSIASSIEGCFEEYFKSTDKKDNQTRNLDGYVAVLNSRSKDEILANFARWEPWHGKFGFSHPWDKYLNIGERLRELAASTLSLKGCLESPRQPSAKSLKVAIKEPCEAVASLLAKTLRELGESIEKMKLSKPGALVLGKNLRKTRQEIRTSISASEIGELETIDGIAVASIVFMLMEMIDRVDVLVRDVEELGTLAGFLSH